MTYLKSGTGQLYINQRGSPVWPIQVKTIVRKTNNRMGNENYACVQLVQERLDQFRSKIQHYGIELDNLKSCLQCGDEETIFRTMETFIQQNQENFRQKIEHKIKLVQYDYNDQVLELQFLEQNPNEYCVRFHRI